MPETLTVHINRRAVHSIEPATTDFETAESFTVDLINHGEAAHVHINLDDDLSGAISLDGGNHFVEAGRTRTIEAAVDQRSRPVSGRLRIVTGYGAETAHIDVSLIPSDDPVEGGTVEIDDRLSTPQPREEPPSGGVDLPPRTVAAVGLVLVSLLIVVVGALIANNLAVILGVGIVLLGIAGAAVLLSSQSRSSG